MCTYVSIHIHTTCSYVWLSTIFPMSRGGKVCTFCDLLDLLMLFFSLMNRPCKEYLVILFIDCCFHCGLHIIYLYIVHEYYISLTFSSKLGSWRILGGSSHWSLGRFFPAWRYPENSPFLGGLDPDFAGGSLYQTNHLEYNLVGGDWNMFFFCFSIYWE